MNAASDVVAGEEETDAVLSASDARGDGLTRRKSYESTASAARDGSTDEGRPNNIYTPRSDV